MEPGKSVGILLHGRLVSAGRKDHGENRASCPRSPNTLAASATCVVTIKFAPTTSGGLNSSLTITDNVSAGSSTMNLTGTGKYPAVSFTPHSLSFGKIALNTNSTLTDTVTNIGVVPLTITKIALTGSNTQYYTESDNCPRHPSTLAAGATCVASVVFTPTVKWDARFDSDRYRQHFDGIQRVELDGEREVGESLHFRG
jgi:hypothetical protein